MPLMVGSSADIYIGLPENGKEIELDTERMKIEDIIQEVDRHSRALNRQAELAGER